MVVWALAGVGWAGAGGHPTAISKPKIIICKKDVAILLSLLDDLLSFVLSVFSKLCENLSFYNGFEDSW